MRHLAIILFWSSLSAFGFAKDPNAKSAPDEKSYSVREISFFENGFPKSLKIRLYGHSVKDFIPCQVIVSADSTVSNSVNDVEITEFIEGIEVNTKELRLEDQDIVDITLDLESCVPMKFFDPRDPEKWSLTKISGPRMSLKKGAAFIPIVTSDNHLIGFAIAPTKDDKDLQQWKKRKSAEKK
jgi:hypothetical protein